MKLRHVTALIFCFSTVFLFFSTMAAAANGTLQVTFKYNDGGVELPLNNAYLYLQDGTMRPPMEKFYKSAEYIFGPSDSLGRFNASVPEGIYYVRLTKRQDGTRRPLGPPEGGDYTWANYQEQITVTAGSVINLGTQYATFYNKPITLTGVITNSSTGEPWPDRYVRAQPEPCIEADYSSWDPNEWVDTNECGSVKYLAQQKTDAQGRYTLLLKEPGSYYIVSSRKLGDYHQQYAGNPSSTGWSTGPITVNQGDNIVLDMNIHPYY
ncbi:MAG: hypothetical protein SCH71_14930 [Desulfobulbaceae bacterium]|nr:hypothetical protein [Desulfobulbaceae bacterium]